MIRKCIVAGMLTTGLTLGCGTSSAVAAPPVEETEFKITGGFDVYLNFWGHELKTISQVLVAAGGIGGAAICGSKLKKVPAPQAKVIFAVCKIFGTPTAISIWTAIKTIGNSNFVESGMCYQFRGSRFTVTPALGISSMTKVTAAGNCF